MTEVRPPLVVKDIIRGKGHALDLFKRKSAIVISGANLCCSSIAKQQLVEREMKGMISFLLDSGDILVKSISK